MPAQPEPIDELPADAGITLVELLVAGVISIVVGAIGLGILLSATDATRRADGQNEQAAGARTALQSWSAILRLAVDPVGRTGPGAARFVRLAPDETRLCVAMGSKGDTPADDTLPMGAALRLVGGQLVEERWDTCTSMMGGDPADSHRVIANQVGLAASGWLVTPLSAEDLPSPTVLAAELLSSSLISGTSPIEAAEPAGLEKIARIAAVQLAVDPVGDPRRPHQGSTFSTVVTMPAGA